MQFGRNFKVVTQLIAGFSLVIFLMACLGGFSLYKMNQENTHVAALRDNALPSVRTNLEMQLAIRGIRASQLLAATATTPDESHTAEDRINAALANYQKASSEYATLVDSPEEKTAYADIQTLMPKFLDLNNQVLELVRQDRQVDAMSLLRKKSDSIRNAIEKDIQTIVDANTASANDEGKQAGQDYAQAKTLVYSLMLAAAVVAIVVALVIAFGVARQLGGEPRDAMALASEIAAGNLRATVQLKPGDHSSLMYSLSTMRDQLAALVRRIKTASESITVSSGEIAQGNTDLSQRTEEQAASLEETASSMEQLTSAVRQNADNAIQASQLASTGSGVARRGGEEISRVVTTMHEIAESSGRVAEIISVIEGIAFQTNILALNAAVEAARAGEQGRGFAVVAGEVRTLAQRSATAAKEIKDLITESVRRIDTGSKLVEDAGRTMTEIVRAAVRTTDIMSEIAAASEEQSTGIGQVNTAITRMDEVTQQNAALVEQASAAAQSLAQQAEGLRDAVSVFSVDDHEASHATVQPLERPRTVARSASSIAKTTSSQKLVRAERTGGNTALADSGADDWQRF
jgi:methyl-accepting chemotaxis protein